MNTSTKQLMKLAFGNIIEWYDAFLYLSFMPFLIQAFLPNLAIGESVIALLLGLAAGNVVRPIGAIIFGLIGDIYGRKLSYNISILMMAVSTSLMGLLPAYATIGVGAPIILVILRLLQGLSMGGQFGTLISMNESLGNEIKYKGFSLGICMSISLLGHSMALIAAGVVSKVSDTSLIWRLPFLLSLILFLVHIVLNKKNGLFISEEKKVVCLKTLGQDFSANFGRLLTYGTLSFCAASTFSMVAFLCIPYMIYVFHYSKAISYSYSQIFLWCVIFSAPFFGLLHDKINNKILVVSVSLIMLMIGLVSLGLNIQTFFIYASLMVVMSFVAGALKGILLPILGRGFKGSVSCLSTNVSYTLGLGIASFMPALLVWLSHKTTLGLPLFIIIIASLLLFASLKFKSFGDDTMVKP